MTVVSWLAVRASVDCPYCHASRGNNCISVTGRPMLARVHLERRGAYILATRGES